MENNNPEQNKLKRLLNVVLYYGSFLLLLAGLSFFKSFFPANLEKLSFGLLGMVAAGITTYLFLLKDKKTFKDIGLYLESSTFQRFFSGVFIGIVLMGLVSTLVVFSSGLTLETNANSGFLPFLLWTLPLVLLALMEEIPARAYVLVHLKAQFSLRISILLSALLFACSHISYGWSVSDSLLGPGIMGILFGTLAVYSRGIAMPTGVHYGFNLMTAAFGAGDQSFNLWVLKAPNGQSLENYQQPMLATLLPTVFFLVIGVAGMEILLRKKPQHAN